MEKLSLFTRVGTARINAAQCPQLARADISPDGQIPGLTRFGRKPLEICAAHIAAPRTSFHRRIFLF